MRARSTPIPVTGMVTPGGPIAKTYRLEGNLVRARGAAGIPRMIPKRIRVAEAEEGQGKGKKR